MTSPVGPGQSVAELLRVGRAHHLAGRLHDAELHYRAVLESDPDNPAALHSLGVLALQAGRCEPAARLIEQAIRHAPQHAVLYSDCAEAYRRLGRLETAIERCRQALDIDPAFPQALNNLGNALQQLGRIDEAIGCYERALAARPSFAEAHNNLGAALLDRSRAGEAAEHFRQAIAIRPEYADAHHNLGAVYLHAEQFDDAIERFRAAIELRPAYAEAWNNLGISLFGTGRTEEAIASYRRALEIRPDLTAALNNLGNALRKIGRREEALSPLRKATSIAPDFADAHNSLGNAYMDLGRTDDAVTHYGQAVALDPESAEAHNNLGYALQKKGKTELAMAHYRTAIAIEPEFAEAYSNLGTALMETGDIDGAMSSYEKALSLKPDFAGALNNLGNAFADLGRADDAIDNYEKALAADPHFAMAWRNLALADPGAVPVERIRELMADPATTERQLTEYHYALGSVLENRGAYAEAFSHHLRANSIRRKGAAYDPDKLEEYVDRMIAAFDRDRGASGGSDSDLPVFIVGLPRSGTSLVEQILSSHRDIAGAGELLFIGNTEETISGTIGPSAVYPECMCDCPDAILRDYAERYLEQLRKHSATARFVTDKMPGNCFRLGLVRALFPNARIIHCMRNPLDVCTSIFTTHFAKGNEYAFDLEDIGRHYLAYERIMAHWHRIYPSAILDVRYEELVGDQEAVSRRLIDHLGLDWDDDCLAFHENARAVRTASNLQVRQPIHSRSVNRWRHYEPHLGPLMAILRQSDSYSAHSDEAGS